MAITSSFANLATVSRASKKTDAGGWDFTNGGTVGTLTEYASGVAATHPTAGLLIEESTTNEIRNPRIEGGTAGTIGSGGALPDYWATSGSGFDVDYGTENGAEYIDLIFSSFTPAGDFFLYFEEVAQVAISQSENWTNSVSAALVSGDLTNVDQVYAAILERNSGGSGLANNFSVDASSLLEANARRFFVTASIGQATAAYGQPYIRINHTSGAWTFTLRLWLPQFENKAYPTSPVRPTVASPAASTRAADLITLSLGDWFSSTAWTLFFNFTPNVAGKTGKVLGGLGADFNDTAYIDVGATSGTSIALNLRSGGSSSANLTPAGQSNYAVGDNIKVAIAAQVNDFAMSLNGATLATDTAGAMPTANTRLSLGNGPWGATVNNTFLGYIKDLRYFPRRLANAEIESLVGN